MGVYFTKLNCISPYIRMFCDELDILKTRSGAIILKAVDFSFSNCSLEASIGLGCSEV